MHHTEQRTYPSALFVVRVQKSIFEHYIDMNLKFCTFTGSTLDVLMGLIYILQKHDNSCSIIPANYQENKHLKKYLDYAAKLKDQVLRRTINGEAIPTCEKIYSIFEPHTEWVNKGKPGGKIELGLKVCIIEDEHQFILHHRVMQKEMDVDIAEQIIKDCQSNFPNFKACSFDKGFDSAVNQKKLEAILDKVIMPKKGKLSKERQAIENDKEFIKDRHQHSAVESSINCLEQHGLGKCLDKGIDGFTRYISMAIAARNVQRIGSILRAKEKGDIIVFIK